jgi:hypothetical protein
MSKIRAGGAALALLLMLALPGASNATERRNGVRPNDSATQTEFSSVRRWCWHHYCGRRFGAWRAWGPRYRWWPGSGYFWRPRFAYYPYWYPRYSYSAYFYPYWRPWYRPYAAVGFGYGARWWW